MKPLVSFFIIFLLGIVCGWYGQSVTPNTTVSELEDASESLRVLTPVRKIESVFDAERIKAEVASAKQNSVKYPQLEILRAAIDLAEKSTVDELEALIEQTAPTYPYSLPMGTLNIYIEGLISLDPYRALNFVRTTAQIDPYWIQYLHSWGMQDPGGAIDFFHSIRDPDLKKLAGQILLNMETIDTSGRKNEVIAALGKNADKFLKSLLLSKMTPEEALEELLLSESSPQDQYRDIRLVLSRWVQQDPNALFARLSLIEDSTQKYRFMDSAISVVLQKDSTLALDLLDTYGSGNVKLIKTVLKKISKANPSQAIPLLEEYMKKTGNSDLLRTLITNWVRHDPASALAYTDQLPLHQKREAYGSISYVFAQNSPEEAIEWALSLGKDFSEAKQRVFSALASAHPTLAEATLNSINNPLDEEFLLGEIIKTKGRLDPKGALELLKTGHDFRQSEQKIHKSIYHSILSRWSNEDVVSAAKYLSDNPFDYPKLTGATQLTRTWYNADPVATTTWVGSLPDGTEVKTEAVYSLATATAKADPAKAAKYAMTLPKGGMRSSAIQEIAYEWVDSAPEEFDLMVEALNLDERSAEYLRKKMQSM